MKDFHISYIICWRQGAACMTTAKNSLTEICLEFCQELGDLQQNNPNKQQFSAGGTESLSVSLSEVKLNCWVITVCVCLSVSSSSNPEPQTASRPPYSHEDSEAEYRRQLAEQTKRGYYNPQKYKDTEL